MSLIIIYEFSIEFSIDISRQVFDEAHKLKDPRSQAHRAATELDAGCCLLLTATPVANSLFDAKALLTLAVPGVLPQTIGFRTYFEQPIDFVTTSAMASAPEFHKGAEAAAELAHLYDEFVLRREKTSLVHTSSSFYYIICKPSELERDLYNAVVEGAADMSDSHSLKALAQMNAVCLSPLLLGANAESAVLLANHLPVVPTGIQAKVDLSSKMYVARLLLEDVLENTTRNVVVICSRVGHCGYLGEGPVDLLAPDRVLSISDSRSPVARLGDDAR